MALGAGLLGSAGALQADHRASEPALEQLTLQLPWRHAFQFAGYYAAVEQGYYRESGLEVRVLETLPDGHRLNVEDEVLSGRANYGVGSTRLLLRRSAGDPVVALAAIYQHSPLVLIALRRSGVNYLQDLHDKPIMMERRTAELLAYFKDEGLDPAKLQIVPYTYDYGKLLNGEVVAMSAYSTDAPFTLRQLGLDFVMFAPRSGGIDFYGDILFTTESEIAEHPQRVKAFREASLRGWDYAVTHTDEIIDLILKKYSQRMSREHLQFEAEQTVLNLHPSLIEPGHMNPGRWQHIADTYVGLGMLPENFSLKGFLYQPNQGPDMKPVYMTLAALLALTIATLTWALPLVRLNRRLREANAAKGRYLAFLTHEIRTPLSGVVGIIDIMKAETVQDKALQEPMQMLDQSTKNMLELVNNVLDFSKLEAGKLSVEWQAVEVGMFVRKLTGPYRRLAEAKGLEFREEIKAGVPPIIVSDGLRLHQILSNLLSNAIKFTATGRVELTVELAPMAQGTRLHFVVRDTGPGIPADKLATLFQPYQQADKSTARQFGGSGLGLSIARELARVLKGDIMVKSVPGVGSTFIVDLEARPLAELELNQPA